MLTHSPTPTPTHFSSCYRSHTAYTSRIRTGHVSWFLERRSLSHDLLPCLAAHCARQRQPTSSARISLLNLLGLDNILSHTSAARSRASANIGARAPGDCPTNNIHPHKAPAHTHPNHGVGSEHEQVQVGDARDCSPQPLPRPPSSIHSSAHQHTSTRRQQASTRSHERSRSCTDR